MNLLVCFRLGIFIKSPFWILRKSNTMEKFIFVLITAIFLFSAMYFTALTGAYLYITPLLFAVIFLTFLLFDIDSFRYGAHAIRYRNLRQLRNMLK